MNNIYIVGIGSVIGDDQIGWLIIDKLQIKINTEKLSAKSLHLIKCSRINIDILESIQLADCVCVIDAVITERAPPGTVWEFSQEEILNNNSFISTHGINFAEIIALGRMLNKLPQHIYYYGIEVAGVNHGFAGISSLLLQCIEEVTEKLWVKIHDKCFN